MKNLFSIILAILFVVLSGADAGLPLSETNPIEDISETNEKIQESRTIQFQFKSLDKLIKIKANVVGLLPPFQELIKEEQTITTPKRYLIFRVLLI